MNLRTRVHLAALLPAVFALLIGAALWISWEQVDKTRQGAISADQILRTVVDMNMLTQEYLLYGSARSVTQIDKNHHALVTLLDASSFQEPDDLERLQAIRQGHADLDRLLNLLLESATVEREHLTGALLVKVQDVRFNARQLAQSQNEKVVAIQRRVDTQIMLALGVLALLSVAMLTVLGRRLVQGMNQLTDGILKIESGDLNHTVPASGSDELSVLANSFNAMTRRLRESTTSIDRLQHEIEERKHAEQATRASEARFRSLFQQAPMPLCFLNQDGLLVGRNARFVEVFGYTEAEVPTIAEWWQKAYPDPNYRAWVLANWNAAVAEAARTGRDIASIEYQVTCKDGSVRTMLISGIMLGTDMLATFFDVTERRQAEDEVRRLNAGLEQRVAERTAELTAANQELDSFAYAVSHDLRAPLRAMSGFSQALQEDYGSQLQGEAKLYLDQIDIAGRKMNELVDGLLVLSRSTRGELEHDVVDLSAMAERQLADLTRSNPERHVAISVEASLTLQGDARMFEVVMRNLLDNAWKYSGRASDPCIRVYGEERDGQHYFCVADNGAGFDMAHANRLFQPFQRLHRQEEFPGIGIGLATVQRIVHRHGGVIEARGEPSKGATFCFSLAAAKETA